MELFRWLLDDSDPSLVYQVSRDLLHLPDTASRPLREKIPAAGPVSLLLKNRNTNGHWGNGVYNPKWTCTHYALYELVQRGIGGENSACVESAGLLLDQSLGLDGGINYAKTVRYSDVCINGMILGIVSYFNLKHGNIPRVIDFLLDVQMPDGGWNCEYHHGARHSSLHTTISVLEGISRNLECSGMHRAAELLKARRQGTEFILRHELFKAETTGEIIKDEFFKYSFPVRWKYDILRCLDYFQAFDIPYDARMESALEVLRDSRNGNGTWKAHSQAGKTYGQTEKNGADGRWNTLRALRVLLKYKREYVPEIPGDGASGGVSGTSGQF